MLLKLAPNFHFSLIWSLTHEDTINEKVEKLLFRLVIN